MSGRSSGSQKENGKETRSGDGERKSEANDTRRFIGLCVNCAKRETCNIPEIEGGIWHCRQYVEESLRENRARTAKEKEQKT